MYTVNTLSTFQKIKKLYRFFRIYGFSRTYVKTAGRVRGKVPLKIPIGLFKANSQNIAMIGCGQFAFATIGFFLRLRLGNCFYGVFDVDVSNANSFTKYYGGKLFNRAEELIKNPKVEFVYIASNHASHSHYAVMALKAGKTVYLEKPISVDYDQFGALIDNYQEGRLYVGYNRPFAPAIKTLKSALDTANRTPMTLSFFISGHRIPADNWYRNPEEGTRVCGNLGHWIDLTIHLMNHIGLPKQLEVSLQTSSREEVDDNLNITFVSDREDLTTIVLTSRTEPFEGINESINLQYGDTIAKIDDFRSLTLWKSDRLIKKRYFKKDVGHKNAINQPFDHQNRRAFTEIEISTLLMLRIKEAVLNEEVSFVFNIPSNQVDKDR